MSLPNADVQDTEARHPSQPIDPLTTEVHLDDEFRLDGVPTSVLAHLIDVHCHPTDSDMAMTRDSAESMPIRICAMATRHSDQSLVADLARAHPSKVIPCFGWCSFFVARDFSDGAAHAQSLIFA